MLTVLWMFLAVGLGGCAAVAVYDLLERSYKKWRLRQRLLQSKAADVAEDYRRLR